MNLRKKNQLIQLAEQQKPKTKPSYSIDFNDVSERAYGYMQELLEELGHDFKEVGDELMVINPNRADSDFGSFKFNQDSQCWADFATEDAGIGPLSFISYLEGISIYEAAKLILDILNGDYDPTTPNATPQAAANEASFVKKPKLKVVKSAEPETVICPVPLDAPAVPESFYQFGKPSHRYVYRSPKGEVLCHILRFPLPDGKKDIRPLTLHRTESGGMQWRMSNLNGPTPLYNLDQMALFPEKAVIIGEGEKSADALSVLFPQFVSTTAIGGAQRPSKADWSPLFGKEVFIWADKDEAGQKYAETIIGILREQDPTARISVLYELTVYSKMDDEGNHVLIPGFVAEKGDDAADALALGWTPAHAELLLKEGHFVEVPLIETTEVSMRWEEERIHGHADNFKLNTFGVFVVLKGEKNSEYFHWISSWVKVIANTRNAEDTGWGVLVEYIKPDGTKAKECLSNVDLQGNGEAGLRILAHLGVDITGNPNGRRELADYLKIVPKINKQPRMARLSTKSGWVEPKAFLTPLKVIGNSDQEWVYTGPASSKSIFESKGTLEEWKTNVASKCVGNSRLILPVCVALSGPLQHVLSCRSSDLI